MDAALIKPQKVRRVVRIKPTPPGDDGSVDVTARGSLVEVADPRALRPRDFRTDYVYGPQASAEDVALCDLPSMMESVLQGTDAVLLIAGPKGAGQADILDGANSLAVMAARGLLRHLQERQTRHRQGGTGGYSFNVKLQCFQIKCESIEDLMTDTPEFSRLLETPEGLLLEGLRSISVVAPDEAASAIAAAQRRRDPSLRAQSAGVYLLEVTQADYWAGWGLFGRMLILESPALDCFAEDRGLVQLREGFDTFRGAYHLRQLVQGWQANQPGDVSSSALTQLLRDVLCGGSVTATVLVCLQQQQPAVSTAVLEFLDAFSKVETNPVCCDHRVAGYARSMRAESLQARQGAGPHRREEDDNSRRIILELEKRLQAAERSRERAGRNADTQQDEAAELQEKYSRALQGEDEIHEQYVGAERERLKACEGVVHMEMQVNEIRDEMSELQYKDNVLLMVLEQEVAGHQIASKQSEQEVVESRKLLANAEQSCAQLKDNLEANRSSASVQEIASAEQKREAEAQEQQLQAALQRIEDMQLSMDTGTEALISERITWDVQRDRLENRVEALQVEFQRSELDTERADRKQEILAQNHGLHAKLEQEKQQLESMRVEHERELQRLKSEHLREIQRLQEEHQREIQRREVERARQEAELLSLRQLHPQTTSETQAANSMLSVQQQLLDEMKALRRGQAIPAGPSVGTSASKTDKDYLEQENRDLRARLHKAEKHPSGDQSGLQKRNAFLEKTMRQLEAERSEFLVRSTVAEEQLIQLEKKMKEITEQYQMQIVQLKMQQRAPH